MRRRTRRLPALAASGLALDERAGRPVELESSGAAAPLPDGARLRLRRPAPWLVALAAYSAVSLVADFPVWPGDPHRLPTTFGADVIQTVWFLAWTPHAIAHGLDPFSTRAINFPLGVDLAQNTATPLLGLITAPLTVLVSPVASLNLLRFLAFTLSAFSAYWVLRRWSGDAVGAFAGGLLYGFSPYLVSQGALHLDLMFVPLPPLLLECCFELLVRQRARPGRAGCVLGLVATAQFYVSPEVLATTAVVAAAGAALLALARPRQAGAHLRRALPGLAAAACLTGAACAWPVVAMFSGPQHYSGPAQGFQHTFDADLIAPLVPTRSQLVTPAALASVGDRLIGGDVPENGSYLGLPLLVVLTWLVARYRRGGWMLYLAALAGVSFVLSLGRVLVVDRHPVRLPFPLPFALVERLPAFDNALPVRMSLQVSLLAAAIVALGLARFRQELHRRQAGGGPAAAPAARRRRLALPALAGLATVASLLPAWPYPSVRVRVHRAETPSGLAAIPAGSIVLAYPYPTPFDDSAMLWQALDRIRFDLIGGYALVRDPRGLASSVPTPLQPSSVEAMLVNSPLMAPDPLLAESAVALRGVSAADVVVVARHGRRLAAAVPAAPLAIGMVTWVDRRQSLFYLLHGRRDIEVVRTRPATRFLEPPGQRSGLAGLQPGEVVEVSGSPAAGTVGAGEVHALRSFLARQRVGTVLVGLQAVDGYAVARWFHEALGRPSRAGAGAEVWTGVEARLRRIEPAAPAVPARARPAASSPRRRVHPPQG